MLILASPFPPPYINIYFLKMAVTYTHLIFILKENEEMKCGHGSTQTSCSIPNKHAYMHRSVMNLLQLKVKYVGSAAIQRYWLHNGKNVICWWVMKIHYAGQHSNVVMQWKLHSSFLKGPCAETDKRRLTVAGQH